MHTDFDAGSIHYEGKWEMAEPWKSRLFWAQWKWHRADRLFYVQDPTGDFKGYIININVPVVYMARDVLISMRATSLTRAIGRVCPENRDFFGPWNGNERSECNLGLQFGADSKRETSSTVSPITSSAMMPNRTNKQISWEMDCIITSAWPTVQTWFKLKSWV